MQQRIAATVNRVGCNNLVAGVTETHDHGRNRPHAARRAIRGFGPLDQDDRPERDGDRAGHDPVDEPVLGVHFEERGRSALVVAPTLAGIIASLSGALLADAFGRKRVLLLFALLWLGLLGGIDDWIHAGPNGPVYLLAQLMIPKLDTDAFFDLY